MNYRQYRDWKETVLSGRPLRRLDCMNAAKALAFLARPIDALKHPTGPEEIVNWWKEISGLGGEHLRVHLGHGVRQILQIVLEYFGGDEQTLWLPEDIYPVYFDLAKRFEVKCYETMNNFNFEFLIGASHTDTLLITDPLTPLGRYLLPHELETCCEWLKESPNRLLIIDAVYCYELGELARLNDLVETNQVIVIHSLSKSWLSPQLLGIAVCPQKVVAKMEPCRDECLWGNVDLEGAYSLVITDPHRPQLQQTLFSQQWRLLAPELQEVYRDWHPPRTGYFSTLPIHHMKLLQDRNMLAVPASVFGSKRRNLSVISCLFDIQANQNNIGITFNGS